MAIKGYAIQSGLACTGGGAGVMEVNVGEGYYWCGGVLKYFAGGSVAIAAADASYPRKDIVSLTSAGALADTTGTPAAAYPVGSTGPNTKTPILPDAPTDETTRCEVWVAAGATGILTTDITDLGITLSLPQSLFDWGLAFKAVVTGITGSPTHFQSADIAGHGANGLKDYEAYVKWEAGGAGAAPQGEHKTVVSSTDVGDIEITAYTAPVAVGDVVLLLHPAIAALINTTYGLSALQSLIGAKNATATADDLSDITTTDLHAKAGRLLLRFSPGAFATNVQGVSRTDVLAIFTAMASYFSASGAAYSVQMNNQTARTNIEQTLEDLTVFFGVDGTNTLTNINNSANATVNAVFQKFAAILGADSANVFNPTLQGSAQTNLDAALYALAQYFATSGAAISSTINPGGSARATLELILEDFADMLAGGTGIITWPAAAKYGNGVSVAEALAYVSDIGDATSEFLQNLIDPTIVKTTKALAALGNYDAEDVMSEDADNGEGTAWTFADCASESAGSGQIIEAIVSCETTGLTPRLTLQLYNATPACELDDNAASNGPTNADMVAGKFIGSIEFPAMEDLGGNSESRVSTSTLGNLPIPFTCANGATALYGVLVTQDAITGEAAGDDMTIILKIKRS